MNPKTIAIALRRYFVAAMMPMIGFAAFGISTAGCLAGFSGTIVSATPQSPIALGSDLQVTVVVRNTGTSPWNKSFHANWVVRAQNFSWSSPISSMDNFVYDSVAPSATSTHVVTLDAFILPQSSGNYSFQVIGFCPANGNDDANYFLMSGGPTTVNFSIATMPPTITIQPRSQQINEGTNVSFTVSAAGTLPLNYQWRLNSTDLTGATALTLNLTNANLNQAGPYSVRVSNAGGSVTSSPAMLLVNPVLPRLFNPTRSNNLLRVSVSTLAGRNYTLQFKRSLRDTNWTSLPAVAGDGSVKLLTDSAATNSQRIYRIMRIP